MSPSTLIQASAKIRLDDALAQEKLLKAQLGNSTSTLGKLQPGSPDFTLEAERAGILQSRIDSLSPEISRLTEEAKSEEQRQQEAQAAAAQAKAELEAQATIDLDQVETLIKTVNSASDTLAAAILELASIDGWPRLAQTHKLTLDMLNRRPKTIVGEIPFVVQRGTVARLQKRHEAGLR